MGVNPILNLGIDEVKVLVLVLAFLLLVSLVLGAALAVLEHYAGAIWSSSYDILAILSSVIVFGVIACLFAVIYKVLPDAPLSWRDVWIGAAFTAGLFSLGKYAIGLYLGNSGVAYYSAQIFFLGAEFTRQRTGVRNGACRRTHFRRISLRMVNPIDLSTSLKDGRCASEQTFLVHGQIIAATMEGTLKPCFINA